MIQNRIISIFYENNLKKKKKSKNFFHIIE